jgi:hypothetical protein
MLQFFISPDEMQSAHGKPNQFSRKHLQKHLQIVRDKDIPDKMIGFDPVQWFV